MKSSPSVCWFRIWIWPLILPLKVILQYISFVKKKRKKKCYPIAFAALLCKLFLIAWNAHGIIVTWYEALVSDWLLANHAHEAFLMPLFALVFKLLHACKNKKRNAMRSYSYVNLLSSYLPFNRGGISSIQKQIGWKPKNNQKN